MRHLLVKSIMITLILIAARMANAAEVNVITINKTTVVEILIKGKTCLFPLTKEQLENFTNTDAKRLVRECLSK